MQSTQSRAPFIACHALVCVGVVVSFAGPAWGQCDPVWTERFEVPAHRRCPAMAFDSWRGVTVMIGGDRDMINSDPQTRLTWEWQGKRWIMRDDVPVGPNQRLGTAVMAFDSDRGVTVLTTHSRITGSETWEFDGQIWTLVSTGGPQDDVDYTMAYDAARGVTLQWGEQGIGTWSWNGASWTFLSPGPIRDDAHFEMAYDAGREVLVMFGVAEHAAETWEWRGTSWELRFTGGPVRRADHVMAYDSARGVVVMHGGFIGPNTHFDDTWTWNGASWKQVATGQPSQRDRHAMVYDELRGEMILFAGCGGGGGTPPLFNDTWAWDGQTWTLRDEGAPLARAGHEAVWDSARDIGVLFGGIGSDLQGFDDTWNWDGTRWRRVSQTGPGARWSFGLAFDSDRGVTVLFGGSDRNLFRDTWEWDGVRWQLRSQSGPPPRLLMSLAYDPIRRETLLFGGDDDGESRLGDTWTWDGQNWTEHAVAGPSARSQYALAYDQARQIIVLFGGLEVPAPGQFVLQQDTWEWNGVVWQQRASTGPSPRLDSVMVYDQRTEQLVLFGGRDVDFDPLGDVWTWDGVTWTELSVQGPAARCCPALLYDPLSDAIILHGGLQGFDFLADGWALAQESLQGDLNCDCIVNAFDIEAFILALFDPGGYQAAYPDCDRMLADLNADGRVDAFDIEPFIERLFKP